MKFKFIYFISVFIVVFSCQKPSKNEISKSIESFIKASSKHTDLTKVYAENDFKPIWVESGGLKKVGQNYLEELDKVMFDGLEKSHYFSGKQTQLLEKIRESKDPSAHAALDIALSQSFLALASDLNIGRIDPSTINIGWKMDRKTPTVNYEEVLLSIAEGESLKESFRQLRPDDAQYTALRSLLESQLSKPIIEEIPVVKSFQGKIEQGDRHMAIPSIRQKLILLEDLETAQEGEEEVYDEELFQAVKMFQKRHGLIDDGVIGADFIAAINYSPADLITKIKVNLERQRWLPDFTSNGKNKIIVNIPDFRLYYVQDVDTVFTSKVVVGKDYRQTPVFKSEMTYLVFSPTWTLPETILWEDVIPSIQEDERYLAQNNMNVFDFQENEINPRKIKWGNLEKKEGFPYLIRQAPGDRNPLGRVKFMFPNDYSIYIHDSPAQSLFSKDERTFSSGCIRMEKPEEFAAILLEGTGDWDEEKVSEAMELEEEKAVPLEHAQDVWILYLTVWDREGRIQAREDVYDRDKKLAKALSIPTSQYFF